MRQTRSGVLSIGLCVSLMLPGVLGCGNGGEGGPPVPPGPKGSATGKVSYQGKPITTGSIMLDSGKGDLVAAPIQPDGTFELRGFHGLEFPVGSYKAYVQPPNVTPDPNANEMPKPPEIPGVPNKYYNAATSGVTVTIKEGKQELNIEFK